MGPLPRLTTLGAYPVRGPVSGFAARCGSCPRARGRWRAQAPPSRARPPAARTRPNGQPTEASELIFAGAVARATAGDASERRPVYATAQGDGRWYLASGGVGPGEHER